MRTKLPYVPTFNEEVANTVSHGVMAILTLLALPFSAVWAYLHNPENPALASVGVSIFVISIILIVVTQELYMGYISQLAGFEISSSPIVAIVVGVILTTGIILFNTYIISRKIKDISQKR